MNKLSRLSTLFRTLARIGAGLSFFVLICAVLLQVWGRSFGASFVWTEELTRFALLYLVAFGAGLSFRSGDMVNVDVIADNLPGRLPWIMRLASALITFGLAAWLLLPAWKYVAIGKLQTSPAMGVRMTWVHLSVWVLLAVLAVAALMRVIGMLTGAEDGTADKKPEEA
jgi:TRAP-type C4-dicarboxylate transport system permease small subunit